MSAFTCPIAQHAAHIPQAIALEWGAGRLDYASLDAQILIVQRRLTAAGIAAFDRVAIFLPNSWQHVVLLHALFRIKAIAVPLSTRFPASTIAQLISNLACKTLVLDRTATLNVTRCVFIEDLAPEKSPSVLLEDDAGEIATIDSNQQATILFSSGSTGLPKAILHSWENHYYSALGSNKNIPLTAFDRWLLSLPLYHVAGIAVLFRCFVAGATVVLPPEKEPLTQTIRDGQITHLSLVSTQLMRLLESSAPSSFPTLKAVLLGGSALPRSLLTRAYHAGMPVYTSYGMTEMASQITTTTPGAGLDELFTSGRLLRYRKIKWGDKGQILVKGQTRFLGYVTASGIYYPFDEEGWYDTGDLGKQDAAGRLVVLGRQDNMFISGGENIHPEEIERVLETYTGINQAIVVPVPDVEFGFRPAAFIDYEGDMPGKDALNEHLKDKIARFMHPVAYFNLLKVGVQEGIKISRKELQEKARLLRAL